MSVEALKKAAHEKMGIPASVLTGQTEEEVLEQVRQLAVFKQQQQSAGIVKETPKSTREQFASWLNGEPEPAAPHREVVPGYPTVKDAGEVSNMPDPRPTREQFAEWIAPKMALDLSKDPDGWKHMT